MGKARIHGNNAFVYVVNPSAPGDKTLVGEIDKFSAKKVDELKKSQPLGDKWQTSQVIHKGWELSFEGGKVDWSLAQMMHNQDQAIQAGDRSPYFTVLQTIDYFDGVKEEFLYEEVSLHGYELDVPQEELTEKFSGFTGKDRTAQSTTKNPTGVPDLVSLITAAKVAAAAQSKPRL